MKRRTVYDMTDQDREAIFKWLDRETSYREMAERLNLSHENVRTHIAGLIRQMYEEGKIIIKNDSISRNQ